MLKHEYENNNLLLKIIAQIAVLSIALDVFLEINIDQISERHICWSSTLLSAEIPTSLLLSLPGCQSWLIMGIDSNVKAGEWDN